jgi:hypothetical protein
MAFVDRPHVVPSTPPAPPRRLLLAAGLAALALSGGCQCIRTPAGIRADEMHRKLRQETERRAAAAVPDAVAGAAASPSPSPGASGASASPFETAQRLESLKAYQLIRRWDAVRHEGLALLTADVDEITRLEIYLILTEAFHESQDRERADEFANKFRKLFTDLQASDLLARHTRERASLLEAMRRMKRKGVPMVFAAADGEERANARLAGKLAASRAPADVLEESLPDGGQVWFSRDAEALQARVSGIDRMLADAIQRDPEFEFYFAVRDPPPPAATGRRR